MTCLLQFPYRSRPARAEVEKLCDYMVIGVLALDARNMLDWIGKLGPGPLRLPVLSGLVYFCNHRSYISLVDLNACLCALWSPGYLWAGSIYTFLAIAYSCAYSRCRDLTTQYPPATECFIEGRPQAGRCRDINPNSYRDSARCL